MRDIAERITEEAEAIEAAPDRLLLVGVARHAGDQRDVRIDAVADRHAFRRLDDVVVFLHPFRRQLRFQEGEGQRAQAGTRGAMDGLALGARHPHRRMRLLHRLRHQVAARHVEIRAAEAGIRTHRQHVGGLLGRLAPHRALFLGRDVEAFHLQRGGRFTGAPVGAAVRHQIERRDAFRHARGMIVFRRHQHDAVAEPDALRALRAGGEEDLRGGGMRIFLQEVMLDLPHVVDAEPVAEFDLRQRVLDTGGVRNPRPKAAATGARRTCRISLSSSSLSSRKRSASNPMPVGFASPRSHASAAARRDELPRRVFLA